MIAPEMLVYLVHHMNMNTVDGNCTEGIIIFKCFEYCTWFFKIHGNFYVLSPKKFYPSSKKACHFNIISCLCNNWDSIILGSVSFSCNCSLFYVRTYCGKSCVLKAFWSHKKSNNDGLFLAKVEVLLLVIWINLCDIFLFGKTYF